jgi:DNA end-binding protein Ku
MAARPGWTGFLRFNLISVPVQGYNAAAPGGGKIGFHLIHAKCHERIRYQKVCPVHGEVPNDEIVTAYEVSKGNYVPVPKEEREALRSEDDKTISVETFVRSDVIDPVFFSGRSYFLVPEGKVAQKPYVVMLEAMRDQHCFAVGRVVFSGKPQVALVHAYEGILAMTILNYESELKKPEAFEKDVEETKISREERELAETLIQSALVDKIDLGKFKDEYTDRMSELIAGKTKTKKHSGRGKQSAEEPAVINLMDALRKSVARIRAQNASPKKDHPVKNKKAAARHTRSKSA